MQPHFQQIVVYIMTALMFSSTTALLRHSNIGCTSQTRHRKCQRIISRQWTLFSSLDTSREEEEQQQETEPSFLIFYNDVYKFQLPQNHRFPMEKYRKVRQRLQQHIPPEHFRVSPLATPEELMTTHAPHYVQNFMTGQQTAQELRNVGFPWSPAGVQRAQSSVGGTVAAACFVCEGQRWAAHVAGGTHHAFHDFGQGFCVFSDMAVAANVVLQRYSHIQRILLLDLDVHQGNGNAVLFQNNTNVFTFSMHCSANYFSAKEKSDLDIELPPHCSDNTYLVTLRYWLKRLKELPPFDLILFQAGVDVMKEDRLGRMDLSMEGVRQRNQLVYEFADQIPLVICMGGGYPRNDDWDTILEAHASVYLDAYEFWKQRQK